MIANKQDLQAIFWDFDGVLLDSNSVRSLGFRKVLENYPAEQVEALLAYHEQNGGLSRYVKFRYFFEVIRREAVTDEAVLVLAEKFSVIMKNMLLDSSLLILESVNWVKANYDQIPMHIVSGSDQNELRFLCAHHQIATYFKDICGSPTPKKVLVANLLEQYGYDLSKCVLVGDSVNDYEAAIANGIKFLAYNNPEISKLSNW